MALGQQHLMGVEMAVALGQQLLMGAETAVAPGQHEKTFLRHGTIHNETVCIYTIDLHKGSMEQNTSAVPDLYE